MNTNLTREEYKALAPYKMEMEAARNNYLRAVPRDGQTLLHAIYQRITGGEFSRTDACGHCQLELLQTVTRWYDSTELEKEVKPVTKTTRK